MTFYSCAFAVVCVRVYLLPYGWEEGMWGNGGRSRFSSLMLQGPFTYEARVPEDINFVPLKQVREFNARELLQVC
jgi:hypothetical protein